MAITTTGEAAPEPVGEPITIAYVARPGLLKTAIINAILIILTLTIYRFWAKTNVRRHIWSCVRINGEPLEYTGTGTELFLGALLIFVLFGLPLVLGFYAIAIWLGPEHPSIVGFQFLIFLIITVLWGMAVYRARRYRLSRTLWRGIRSTLAGSSMSYSLLYFAALLLRMITLGWSTPAMNLNLQERMIGDMRFGNLPFRFKGGAGPLYGRYAICWFLAIVIFLILVVAVGAAVYAAFGTALTEIFRVFDQPNPQPPDQVTMLKIVAVIYGIVGLLLAAWFIQTLVWSIYVAREMNVFASYTTIDNARFKFNATAGSLVWLWIGNLLLIIFTLGIAIPFAQQRLVRYLCDRLSAEGTVNISKVLQSREMLGRTGEGLADAFDIGGFI